jgi:hypothetical protein
MAIMVSFEGLDLKITCKDLTPSSLPKESSLPVVYPSPDIYANSDSKIAQNESFTQEEFEPERLNELLRNHIQLRKDEFYQEPFGENSSNYWRKQPEEESENQHGNSNYEEHNRFISPPTNQESPLRLTSTSQDEYESFNLPVSTLSEL